MLSRRHLCVSGSAAALLAIPFLLWQFVSLSQLYDIPLPRLWESPSCPTIRPTVAVNTLAIPQRRHNVAIASTFDDHHNVYLSLVWTLQRVMDRSPSGGALQVYAPVPFKFGFQEIVDTLQLYRGEVRNPSALIDDINSNKGAEGIDIVVLGTCEVDLHNAWAKDLLAAWDARDAAHKFMLVCMVHNIQSASWQDSITDWAQRGAIRILPISEHVATAFRRSFLASADSPDAVIRSAGYEHIRIDVHIPIFDLPRAVNFKPSRTLSDAVIQGTFSLTRGDYIEFFAELKESLARNSKVWGYLPQTVDSAPYAVDTTLRDPPFRLFIIGSGELTVPQELKNIVSLHMGLNYTDFYALMHTMDICVPAFAPKDGYYDVQASSTIAMAVECNVPILVTERIKEAYIYINDDRPAVTRPAAMREVEALRALRTNDARYFLNRTGIARDSPTARAAEDMLDLGWARSEDDFRSFKQDIWDANDRVAERLLRDM
ncbi:hypothetical protein B0H17DRAFT_934873 [Mycena rosella]|uniref:Uncharacterized protein n=1 Tax=Mycena rosella TaxID=1033263 RepID=A0AAD7DKD1_MYCRO|nr:hypothetical protein B0H17DRAFT_934873 [Mycena rosella]